MVSFKAIEGKLKPCPFCGGEADEDSCDVLIKIGCNKCGYHMAFKGLLRQKEEHPDRPIASVDGKRIYYQEAYEDAIKKWNTREADKVITHHKYKRCLAMAKWCNERHTFNETNEKRTWLHKWHNRWLELSEKFKPNSTDQ